ncbi:hypothetical protein [Lacipirellula parvula]|uniref:Uncharacterized protein n=1 Tax=Lacipirellula parvula TaxID=2650471 RepID=A0A5K7XGS7_9BACT|nr:hypothetical protein [Lacipirellula parvula]BBO33496.1 hypothetical protein PLANPX_3108 [Lacipirellula parvula]
MQRQYIRQRERVFTEEMKVKFCRLVRESYSLAEAAQGVGVTLRTVQRYRREEEDFDQEVRMAKLAKPDPLKLMESAARTHWRRGVAARADQTRNLRPQARRPRLGPQSHKGLTADDGNRARNTPEERVASSSSISTKPTNTPRLLLPQPRPLNRPREPKMADTPLVFRERAKSAPVIHNYGIGTPDEWSFAAKPEPPRSHAPRQAPNAEVTPPPEPTLAPGSSNRGHNAPPALTEAERAQRHQDLLDWGVRLMQNEQRQKDRDKYDHLMSRKTKKATQATRQQKRQQNRRRAA